MSKNNSPYNAGLTGCRYTFHEMNRILPLLMSDDSDVLLKQELIENKYLLIKTEKSRQRTLAELKRRYNSVPRSFWEYYLTLSEDSQKVALLYVILKTYRIALDFHLNVTINKWKSIDQTLTTDDIFMEFNEVACRDEFVNSWTDMTRKKITSSYLTILRQAGMLNEQTNQLSPLKINREDFAYYIKIGETWFLDACLLMPYEIEQIKEYAL